MSVDPAVLLEMLQAHDNPRRGQWVRGNRSIVMLAFDHASPIRSAEQGFLSMTPCGIWSGYSQLPFSHLELFPVSFSNTNDSRGPTMIHHVPSYKRLKAFCARSVDKHAAWEQQQQRQQGAEGKMADVPEPVITEIGPWSRNHTGCFLWRSILDAFRLDLFTRFHTLLF